MSDTEKDQSKTEGLDAESVSFERLVMLFRERCKIVYFPGEGEYPIEHNMRAGKDAFDFLVMMLVTDQMLESASPESEEEIDECIRSVNSDTIS